METQSNIDTTYSMIPSSFEDGCEVEIYTEACATPPEPTVAPTAKRSKAWPAARASGSSCAISTDPSSCTRYFTP